MTAFRRFPVVAVNTALLLITGCARYEYDIVSPPDLARHVGQADEVIRAEPLEYRLRSYENRLVIDIFNPTTQPITLLGDRSYIVDPRGQSRPLRGQSIAPDAFIRLILPPMRPYYRDGGPTIGFGIGVGFSRAHRGRVGHGHLHDPFWDGPRYYTDYDESDATWWDWDGETDARLHLAFGRGEQQQSFSHDFTFHRRKM